MRTHPSAQAGRRAGRRALALAAALLAACSGDGATTPETPSQPERPPEVIDYVSVNGFSGANLGARITAAINSLPSTGGVVDASEIAGAQQITSPVQLGSSTKPIELRLGNATITASSVAFVLYNRSKIIGDGSTVIVQASGANQDALVTGGPLQGCELANFTLDGNRAGNTAYADGIALTGADGCRVHHLTVQNTVGYLHPAIFFYGPGNQNNTVEYNHVRDIGTLTNYADGIYVSGPGNKVLFNRIDGATDFGVVAETCSRCVVKGNYITNTPAGIAMGSGVAGATGDDNVVSDNVITGGNATAWGVITVYKLYGLTPVATAVTGNIVRAVDHGHGIMIKEAEQVSLLGNVISDVAVNYDEAYGIIVWNSRNVSITGGSVQRTGSFGIGIGGSSNVKVSGTLITDSGRHNGMPGVGLDAFAAHSSSISLERLTVFDTNPTPSLKKMPYCIDFALGGSTDGVLLGGNLYDDGTNAVGCRDGTVRTTGATRVTTF